MTVIGGIDLKALTPHMKPQNFPDTVPGRVVHIDADFLAYMTSYERKGETIKLEDMQHNCQTAVEKIRRQAAAQSVHLHLTPSSSNKGGRFDIAIQKPYQGTRGDKEHPRQLHIMREWMGRHFPATLHQKCEADDGMSSMQYAALRSGVPDKSIICSKDKDLCMVPGLHLDWDTGEISQAEDEVGKPNTYGFIHLDHSKSSPKIKGYGTKFFWAQMLMGDPADHIQGLPFLCGSHGVTKPKKVGPVLADYLLSDVHNDKDAFVLIKKLYENCGKEVGFVHHATGAKVPWPQVMISEMKMLWMRREAHDPDDVLKWLKETCV